MDLVLPLKRVYFDAIKAGDKTEEFRLRTAYWRQRLERMKAGDRLVLTLGYPPREDTARRLVVPWAQRPRPRQVRDAGLCFVDGVTCP